MTQITISTCPICNGREFINHFTCIDYTSSNERFSLKKCIACELIFTDPRPDEATLPNYYLSDKYISHTGGNKSLIDNIYRQARKITLGWKRKLVSQYSTSRRTILDIGCGTGEFLHEMKSHNWNAIGVEPSENARETAQTKTGIQIHKSLADISQNKFNTITLWHVLEHLPDPNQAIQKLNSLLDESGTVFIAVPNSQSYDAKHYQSYWAGYDVPRHLWHFSKKNMKILLENNGLKLIKVLPMRLDSFYVALLSESYKNPKRIKLIQLLTAFVVGLYSNIKGKKNLEYSSLIYVVKR